MKIYPKEVYIFELEKDEVKILEGFVKEMREIKLSEEQENFLDCIEDNIDSILHP